ncbi:MAG TPA: site-2 protease family protein [Candidatus Saccharibacteria bacterium]|nr:site-2 protease family protein [Candidatus Saccharibacteria bacterium]HRK94608.1 site-2 protease family protein [Candidatus Saccharibacteria bacterium]
MEIDLLYIAIVIVVILFSMTLHEAMHGFVAFWLGDDTAEREGRLTLNPIKHIDPFLTILLPVMLAIIGAPIFGGARPVPFNPARLRYDEWGAALVAVAGPLTNFVIAFLLFASYQLFNVPQDTIAGQFLVTGVLVNLGFFVFNMIPIPPLDGSRIIYALAPDFVRRGMEAIEQFGLIFIFAIVLIASPVLGLFIRGGTTGILQAFSALFGG